MEPTVSACTDEGRVPIMEECRSGINFINTRLMNKNRFMVVGASFLLLSALGVGCQNERKATEQNHVKDYFAQKENCAKYIPSIEKEVENGNDTSYDRAPAGTSALSSLVKVCYSATKNTCLSGANTSMASSGKVHYTRLISDVLTKQNVLLENKDVAVTSTEGLIQETDAFREGTITKMDELGCVN